MRSLLRTFLASLAIVLALPLLNVKADRPLSEEEAFRFLQEALDAQIALTEKPRSMKEIEESLGQYFTKEYTKDFIEMNVKENMDGTGYLAYGTDFALYYIPFFTYDENTKLAYDSKRDKWYVYEWFEESSEGPVSYAGHYEAIGLTFTNNGWSIDDYQISFDPNELSDNSAEDIRVDNKQKVTKSEEGIWGAVLGFIKYASITPFASLGWISVE